MHPLMLVPRSIDQAELEFLVRLDTQIRDLRVIRDAHRNRILGRLLDDIPVEPGRHKAEIRGQDRPAGRLYRLIVDGHLI